MLSDSALFGILAATFFGFTALAVVVLAPFWKLLNRAEQEEQRWTPEAIARATRAARHGGDGAPGTPPKPAEPPPPPSAN